MTGRSGTTRSDRAFKRAERNLDSALAVLTALFAWEIGGRWGLLAMLGAYLLAAGLHGLYGLGLRRGERA